MPGWLSCGALFPKGSGRDGQICAAGYGTPQSKLTQNISSPAMDGKSAQFSMDPVTRETLRRHQGSRDVVLCTSTNVRVPTALGLINPAVVIPDWLMQELSPLELNQILLHASVILFRGERATPVW